MLIFIIFTVAQNFVLRRLQIQFSFWEFLIAKRKWNPTEIIVQNLNEINAAAVELLDDNSFKQNWIKWRNKALAR